MPPSLNIDKDEVQQMASPGAPADFIQLAVDCCALRPADWSMAPQILAHLGSSEEKICQALTLKRVNIPLHSTLAQPGQNPQAQQC